jgi:hypothetical protein
MKTKLFPLFCIGIIFFLSTDCKKEEPVVLVVLSTAPVTEITTTTATSGGTLAFTGKTELFTDGVCWNTTGNPSTADSKTVDGLGNPQFVSNLSGLIAGTTYYVRAYATNSAGIAYGDQLIFTTLGNSPTATTGSATNVEPATATLNGIVNANYLSTIVTFEYGTSTDYGQEITAEQSPIEGTTNTNVSAILTGLTGGINYYYRVKAVNSSGTVYGDNMTFNFAHLPVLTTVPASDITANSATSGGNITDDGGAAITDRGVFYSTGPIPRYSSGHYWAMPQRTHDGTGAGNFTSSLTGLSPYATYNIRAYAVNSAGLAYGDMITFTTLPPPPSCDQVPFAATSEATNISSTSATLNGTVNANGSSTTVTFEYKTLVFGRYFWTYVWKTVTATQSPVTGTTLINVSADVTGLKSGTQYPFRVKAVNSCGTVYGENLSFTLH